MNKSEVEYKALRYESAKMVSQMAMDIKAGRVIVEQVDVEKFGKRVRKFRCPPGTRRAGKWTNSMGTTCNLGPMRANLAKLGSAIERVAIGDGGKPPKPKAPTAKRKKEKRTILGGIGKKLVGAADDLATLEELEEALKDKKKGKKRSLLGRKLTEAADVLATEDEIEEALKEAIALKKKKDRDSLGVLAGRKEVKKLRATVPADALDDDRKAYDDYLKQSYRDNVKAGGKGLPNDLLPFDEWVDADKPERQNVPETPEKPKTPKASKPKTPKPVADEDLPDFEMPSKVPTVVEQRQKYIAKLKKDFDNRKKELLSNRPDGISDADWKAYKDDINSRKIQFGYGGGDNIPDLPEYKDWKGKTQGDLPTPETTKLPDADKPKKPKKPSGPAAASDAVIDVAAQKNEKNKGKKPKKLPGKQYGGVFKNEKSVKEWGFRTAIDRNQEIYVVKTDSGKFRIVDKERFLAGDEEAVFAFGPDGSIIDLPDPKADKDEIVLDVENIVEENADEAAKEIADLADLDNKLELTKSQTGMFLPDDLSSEMLDEYGLSANMAFLEAFQQQRQEVLSFWESRIGDEKFDTSEEMLSAIDKLIADQDSKSPKNEKLLGVMRTERKNFVAMWVADKKGDDLDPYERFNYIQPKRRAAIIESSEIGGLVVNKKKIKPKEKIDLDPTVDLIPDGGETADLTPEVDATPEVPENKAPEIKPNGSAYSPPKAPMAREDAKQLIKQEVEWHENYAKALAGDKFNEEGAKDLDARIADAKEKYQGSVKDDVLAAKDSKAVINQEISKLEEDIEKKKSAARKLAEEGEAEEFESKMDEVFDSITELQYKKRLVEELDQKIIDSENKSIKEDDTDLADVADTNEAAEAWKEYLPDPDKPTYKDWLDDKEWYESTKNQGKANLAESPSPPEGDTSWFETEKQVNDHFDGLIGFMDEQYGINVSFLEQKQQEGKPITASDVKFLAEIDGMKEYYEVKRAEALEGIKKADVDVVAADKISVSGSKNASAIQVFFGGEIEGYDHKKLVDVEDAKLGDSLAKIITRQNSKAKYNTDLPNAIEKLPENFTDLSPEEQRAAIREATGAADDLTAAKILARSAVVNRYGKNTTLQELNTTLEKFNDGQIGEGIDNDIMDARIAASSERLAKAQEALVSLPNGADPVTRLVLEGELNDARADLMTNLLINHKLLVAQGDMNAVSKNAQLLVTTKDSLPERVGSGIGYVFNGGLTVESVKAFPKVPKGMPKPTGLDSTYLGSMQPDGSAIAYRIPIGYNGIFTVDDAAEMIGAGSKLSEIPDEFLFDAIKLNTGEGKRFSPLFDKASGFNETVGFVDGLTGKKFIVKLADRNDQEHTQEAAGSIVAQILGQPVTGMRFGSGLTQKALPGHKAELEGKKMGDQRALMIEHVANMFDPEKFEILGSPPSVSSADIDPESLARLMVLDRSMNYFDRTAQNVIAVRNKETGKIHLHPIDHGNAFYPFQDGKSEVSYGFKKITKSDNIPLHKYLDNMSEEDRVIFAKALRDAIKRYKKADYKAEFTKLAEVQSLTDIERERLMKHADFLEGRKESLDWDKMSKDLFLSLGYTSEDADELLAGGGEVKAFILPQDTPTLANSGDAVSKLPKKMSTGKFVLYDGGSIEGFSVNAAEITTKGSSSLPEGFTPPESTSTMLTFKLREIPDEIKNNENGWQFWRNGHLTPHTTSTKNVSINFDDAKTSSAPGSSAVSMKIKQLDDGTIIIVSQSNNNWDGTVRIIAPGKASDALSDQAKITEIMSAAGVKEHGLPTAEQIRDLGIRRAAAHILGDKNAGEKDIDELTEQLASKGIDIEDIVLETGTDGTPNVRISQEGIKKIMANTGVTHLSHSITYGTSPSKWDAALLGIFTSGGLASTNTRYNSGIYIDGASTGADVSRYGSDLVFNYTRTGGIPASGESYHFYSFAEFNLARLDAMLTPNDDYGKPSTRIGILNNVGSQYGIRQSQRVSTGIFVVPEAKRQELIDTLKARKITEVDGVPIEMLLATPGNLKTAYEALRKYWEDKGVL